MYVRNIMQKDVMTITSDCKINEALSIMDKNKLHRLPVVAGNKLIGLITEGMIAEHTPSKATSLSIHEMNYLLSKMTVSEIMVRDVITVSQDTLLENAAQKMRDNDIGCLPVVTKDNTLIGIITISNLVDSFINMIGLTSSGVRYEIDIIDDKVGVLADITAIFAAEGINLLRVSVSQNDGNYVIIVLTTTTEVKDVEKKLKERGYIIRAKHVYKKT